MTKAQRHRGKALTLGKYLADEQSLAEQLLTIFGVDVPTATKTAKYNNTNFWDHVLDIIEDGEFRPKQNTSTRLFTEATSSNNDPYTENKTNNGDVIDNDASLHPTRDIDEKAQPKNIDTLNSQTPLQRGQSGQTQTLKIEQIHFNEMFELGSPEKPDVINTVANTLDEPTILPNKDESNALPNKPLDEPSILPNQDALPNKP